MAGDEGRRLQEIRADGDISAQPSLKYNDLALLLRADDMVRYLICQVADEVCSDRLGKGASANEAEQRVRAEIPVEDCNRPSSASNHAASSLRPPVALLPSHACRQGDDLLGQALAPELRVLALVKADEQLRLAWLGDFEEDLSRQLVRLVAVTAQWEQALLLWDRLAERCKQAQRPATAAELELLQHCLAMHNLNWHGPQARTQLVSPGVNYDVRLHERGTIKGYIVNAQWLPGLINPGGAMQRKPLVKT